MYVELIPTVEKGGEGFTGQENAHTASKPLRIHTGILCGLFIVLTLCCSGETASRLPAKIFRGILRADDAGGLAPVKEDKRKSTERDRRKACCPLSTDGNQCREEKGKLSALWPSPYKL